VKLALVTNATTRLPSDLAILGLSNAFDCVFNSSEIGFFKPEPEIYTHVLKSVGVEPNEAVFVDDGAAQVTAAKELGIWGHQYTDIDQLRQFLLNTIGAMD